MTRLQFPCILTYFPDRPKTTLSREIVPLGALQNCPTWQSWAPWIEDKLPYRGKAYNAKGGQGKYTQFFDRGIGYIGCIKPPQP
jgi:hypothetical protein